jgi:heat shock protein HslJ
VVDRLVEKEKVAALGHQTGQGQPGTLDGAAACTTYGGTYRTEGDSISISVQAGSALQCTCADVEACTAQDAGFLERLPMATNFSMEGTRLLFLDPSGMRLMELTSLLR